MSRRNSTKERWAMWERNRLRRMKLKEPERYAAIVAKQKAWRLANLNACKDREAAHRIRDREKILARKKRYRDANKAKISAYNRKYELEHPSMHKESTAKRRASLIQRSPCWADKKAISFFYECCPAGCHVDHVVPLRAKNVSGLHVETNLQWLTSKANLTKRNAWAVN